MKGSDGVYHVPGELILAAKDVQYNVYNMIKPVFRVAGSVPLVVLTPMFRYVAGRCCGDEDHLTNAGDPEFESDLAAKLDEVRINMRTFLFMDNIRCANVINPTPLMTKMKREECWPGEWILFTRRRPFSSSWQTWRCLAWTRWRREAAVVSA